MSDNAVWGAQMLAWAIIGFIAMVGTAIAYWREGVRKASDADTARTKSAENWVIALGFPLLALGSLWALGLQPIVGLIASSAYAALLFGFAARRWTRSK